MTETKVRLPDNVVVTIQPPLHQQKQWLKGRYYEAPMLAHIRRHYHGGTFIDGGACIGNHTLFFARFCADQVLAVEPVVRNMAHLQRNVALSNLSAKVTPVPAALGAQPGRGAMRQMGKYHGLYNLVAGDEIDVTTLDIIAALARHPITLVKLDVQWSELAALRGAEQLLDDAAPALFVELVDKPDVRAADAFLARFGYKRGARFGGQSSPVFEYTVRRCS